MAGELERTSLMQIVIRLMEASLSEGENLESLKSILALLCLLSITTQNPSSSARESQTNTSAGNPLQKILGQLSQNGNDGNNGPSPEMLMTLLPLLNNPQMKNKLGQLNPATIAAVMGMLNNMGGKQTGGPNKEPTPSPQPSEPSAALTSISGKEKKLDWTKKV